MTEPPADPNFCTVETTSGRVRGLVHSGVREFRGVPYGASTAGPNRFRGPQPPIPWTGVRDCFGHGPVSPQIPSDVGNDYVRLVQFDLNVALGGMSEDCLHLNVWTPGTEPGARRAVLFSIHGGGFAIGSGNNPMYDGARLAGFGDVVVVTVTHRLASLGYLNLADLDPGGDWADAGAAGILDLVAALRWVRDNIAGFGGDPGRVMIFGQSGGGWKVSTLLGMPAARGLFHRAAVQSGSLVRHVPREAGAAVADLLVTKLEIKGKDLRALRQLPWSQILGAQTEVGVHLFAPILDGLHLPRDPADPQALLESRDIPLIVSTTLDDAGLFFTNFDLDDPTLKSLLTLRYGEHGNALHALYRKHFPTLSAYLLHARIITDAGFRRFAHIQAERKTQGGGAPVYSYLWEWPSPAFEGKFGAVHAMDVSASFHNERDAIVGGGTSEAKQMCESLASVWVSFAKNGEPKVAGIPPWPAFETTRRSTMMFGARMRTEDDPYAPLREFWQAMPEPASVLG